MGDDDIRGLAADAFARFNEREDRNAFFDAYDPDVALHGYPAGLQGLDGLHAFHEALWEAFPDAQPDGRGPRGRGRPRRAALPAAGHPQRQLPRRRPDRSGFRRGGPDVAASGGRARGGGVAQPDRAGHPAPARSGSGERAARGPRASRAPAPLGVRRPTSASPPPDCSSTSRASRCCAWRTGAWWRNGTARPSWPSCASSGPSRPMCPTRGASAGSLRGARRRPRPPPCGWRSARPTRPSRSRPVVAGPHRRHPCRTERLARHCGGGAAAPNALRAPRRAEHRLSGVRRRAGCHGLCPGRAGRLYLDLMWTEPVWARALRRGASLGAGLWSSTHPGSACRNPGRSRSHARGAGGRSACRDGRRRGRAREFVVRVGVHDRWRCPLRHPSAGARGRALSLVAIRAIVQDEAGGGLDRGLRRQIRGDRGRVG